MATPVPPEADHDWTYEVADRIESTVTTIRDKTTERALLVARIVVYGVVVAVLGIVLLLLFVTTTIRILIVYVPIHPIGRRIWVVDAIAAAIFLGSGAFLWRMRRPKGVR